MTTSVVTRSLNRLWCLLGFAAVLTLPTPPCFADVRLPSIFSDHMVLQQNQTIRVWGWSDPGESVTVSFSDHTATTAPNNSGRWQVELPGVGASSTPQKLVVKGNNTIEVEDVLVGEVWLCSGQSNMAWTVARSSNADEEIAAAKHPLIRHIAIPKTPSFQPKDDAPAQWQICSPETAGNFTACGYFMARELHQQLGVPIGLVNSSWGGTRVEPWTPPVGFKNVDALQDIYQSIVGRTPGTDVYQDRLRTHLDATQSWLENAEQSLRKNEGVTANPSFPAELMPFTRHQDPTMLFNGMIHPVLGFPIKGAIWYQGEANHSEGMLYTEKKKALINGWRERWQQGDFPFYFVQIAPYTYGNENPEILAQFWEAQEAVQHQVPHTGMVVINDIATTNNIHPPAKQEVGKRLAGLALKNDYGRTELVAYSPTFDSLEILQGKLKVNFTNTGGGLTTRDGKAPTHFEIIGPGSAGFQPASADIAGDSVILQSADVSSPVAFRFAWHKTAEPNLMGGTGLPVGAVRGGTVPAFVDTLPIDDQYELVYDLDLSNLGPTIEYDIDHSDHVKDFDRIAYLLELVTNDGKPQSLFVSMDAFTDDAKKIGIPTTESGAHFQTKIGAMDVYSNVADLQTGTAIQTGNIEFWPNNYSPNNSSKVNGASNNRYDFGDSPGEPTNGYGSMQIHNTAAKQTLFAINQWRSGDNADIGIGNSNGETRDWTFAKNANSYRSKRLRIYVQTR